MCGDALSGRLGLNVPMEAIFVHTEVGVPVDSRTQEVVV